MAVQCLDEFRHCVGHGRSVRGQPNTVDELSAAPRPLDEDDFLLFQMIHYASAAVRSRSDRVAELSGGEFARRAQRQECRYRQGATQYRGR